MSKKRRAKKPPDDEREYRPRKRTLKPIDFLVCPLCQLRGHLPGDPDRCRKSASTGVGQSAWMAGEDPSS